MSVIMGSVFPVVSVVFVTMAAVLPHCLVNSRTMQQGRCSGGGGREGGEGLYQEYNILRAPNLYIV